MISSNMTREEAVAFVERLLEDEGINVFHQIEIMRLVAGHYDSYIESLDRISELEDELDAAKNRERDLDEEVETLKDEVQDLRRKIEQLES